jgi:hypothetical protein
MFAATIITQVPINLTKALYTNEQLTPIVCMHCNIEAYIEQPVIYRDYITVFLLKIVLLFKFVAFLWHGVILKHLKVDKITWGVIFFFFYSSGKEWRVPFLDEEH